LYRSVSGIEGMAFAAPCLLRRLFLQKVNLPSWWFANVTASDGFGAIVLDGPRWLRNHVVLPMPGGVWRGIAGEGSRARRVTLHDDSALGLRYVVEGKEPEDASV
jgi:hypothetical protein